MTASRDPDRLIHAFLHEGLDELPDPVYDAVRDRIEQTRQRAGVGLWRTPDVNRLLKIGLAAAAVVVIAVVGFQFLGDSNTGSPGASESAEPSATATPRPSPTPTDPESTYGPLSEGPYVLAYEQILDVRMTVTIPAPDWYGLHTYTFVEKNGMAGPPQGAGLTVWRGDAFVYGDPCAWESTRPDDPAASLDELVAALSAQASRDATPPVDVTVGGYPGKMLTLHVPEDAVFTDCDRGEFRTLIEFETGDARFHQGPGQIDEVWVVDVDGTLVFIDAGYFADTPAEDVEEMRAMVESATFELR
jgi:hypothetical protein